jgi:hypothetical protein
MSTNTATNFDIFELSKRFKDEETRFTFLLDVLNSIYENTEEEHKKRAIKTLVTQIIELYSHETSRFRSDPRLLRAWDLLGKTSNTLGYDVVMKKLDDLGYFKSSIEFYTLWATYLVAQKDRITFEKIHARVYQLFHKNKNIVDMFSEFAKKIGPRVVHDEDVTENVFGKLSGTPVVRPPLAVVNEESERTSSHSSSMSTVRGASSISQESLHRSVDSTSRSNSISTARSAASQESQKSVDENNTFVVDPSPQKTTSSKSSSSSTSVVSKPPAANYSFTTHLYRNACDAFGETLPLSQEVHEQHPPAPIQSTVNGNNKDFSVFVEEEEEPMDTRQVPSAPVPSRVSPVAQDSPVLKKSRNRRDSDNEIDPGYDNPFGDVGDFRKSFMPPKNVFDDKVIDDPTISGLNKQSSTRASSTPTSCGRSTVPTFEVSPTASFPLASNAEENKPFTFAPVVSVTKPASPPKRTSVPPLSDVISRMSIAPPLDDLDATTHDITIMPEVDIKAGTINPWSEGERSNVLQKAPPMVEQHEFLTSKCPSFTAKGATVNLGGETFKILKFIAQGGFARIYKTQGEDGKKYAIKLEMPSCPWEVYICKSLSCRLPQEMQPFVMSIRDAFIFSNASAIVYDYYPMKTLLDLANSYKQDSTSMDGMLVAFVGVQIAEILNYVHQAKIIHADIKPDNFVIVDQMSSDLPNLQYMKPFVKLIDWGRAIDMSYYPHQTFKGRAGTNGFDCHEMQEGRPWTYQTDFFGYVGTMHVLMFNTYMKTFYHGSRSVYIFTEQLKRRYPLCETWTSIFREFLNIPSCDAIPSWEKVVVQLKQDLEDFATEDVTAWRRAVDRCNAILRKTID